MPQPSKFAGVFSQLNQTEEPAPAEKPNQTPEAPKTPEPFPVPPPPFPRSRAGRPRGKRSSPDYETTTLLLRKDTKRAVSRRLEDEEVGMDLSDLAQHLLADWLKR